MNSQSLRTPDYLTSVRCHLIPVRIPIKICLLLSATLLIEISTSVQVLIVYRYRYGRPKGSSRRHFPFYPFISRRLSLSGIHRRIKGRVMVSNVEIKNKLDRVLNESFLGYRSSSSDLKNVGFES